MSDRYRARGVSAQKEDVHAAVGAADPGLFPGAFCKLVPDVLSGDPAGCLAMHADGAGTKSVVAYLAYRESGDVRVFEGIAQDALVMNVDDLLCVGALGPYLYSNTIGRHARRLPGEVLQALLHGFARLEAQYADWGMPLLATGGETADVGDVVATLLLDVTVVTRLRRDAVVANDGVRPGDIVVGLASDGQASYEPRYNSGIGSNGLTSARHDLLSSTYAARYAESFDPETPADLRYSGPFRLEAPVPDTPLTVGQALLSPTRSYAPLIKALLEGHRDQVGALVHCTGGGQTKCLRTGRGLHYVKDTLFEPPPLFRLIRRVSGTDWRELYQVFNMGHRLEVIGRPALLPVLEQIGRQFGVAVKQVGHCEGAAQAVPADAPPGTGNRLTLHTPGGVESYP
jgi:phosphoribosylformylglycinamidine cyclo-ligase